VCSTNQHNSLQLSISRALSDSEAVLGIFGAGGHGREIAWLATAHGVSPRQMRFVVDSDFRKEGSIHDITVMEYQEFARNHSGAPMVVAVGDPSSRRAIVARLTKAGHSFPALISPYAILSHSVELGEGVIVFPGAIVSVNVAIGAHVHINVNCSLSHDVEIGPFSSLSPGATVCGHVKIGRNVFVGAKSCIVNGAEGRRLAIGDGAVVAAGACVTGSVPAQARVGGVPARALRPGPPTRS
jgi:sugar O-acyltransferase (sialic acid O-acetyltransferase NeuD family)